MKREKYDANYIAYVERGESAAVYITRDIVKSIDTKNKWICVSKIDGKKLERNLWDFKSFEVEIFPRKTRPIYPEHSSIEYKKYITWETATNDIDMLKEKGYKGPKFKVYIKLVDENKGKYKIEKWKWDTKYKYWVPLTDTYGNCEIRDRKIPLKPDWNYHIIKIERLKNQ